MKLCLNAAHGGGTARDFQTGVVGEILLFQIIKRSLDGQGQAGEKASEINFLP
jgi:hypothetical protein